MRHEKGAAHDYDAAGGGNFICDRSFDREDFAGRPFPQAEYENCTFTGCRMMGCDLSGVRFTDCRFEGCDMSLATLENTIFHGVRFTDCKLLGLKFDSCDTFGFSAAFDGCIMDNCTFFKRKLTKTHFDRCRLRDADFGGCDLREARFAECDLARAQFTDTDLRKADLRTAFNYTIDPNLNKLNKAKFSPGGLAGLLKSFGIDIDASGGN